ncbi:hypothetical protein LAD74_00575 [Mycoplasma sp. U97]|uniref:MHO_4530 family protein n=1 Tax=Mycoplasma tauri TaxID=547987 RepID=UPI001CBA7772|nr:hypothetical protein [Mycoplasma tauri]MBZ4212493.1 hypothetical protein [Mycoplasma tauri]
MKKMPQAVEITLWIFFVINLLFFIGILFYFTYKKVAKVNSFNTNGILFFKINPNSGSVVRLSDKKISGSLNFDDSSVGIEIDETINFENFINYFHKESHDKIREYIFSKKFEQRFSISTRLNFDMISGTDTYKSLKDVNFNIDKKEFLVKFYPSVDKKAFFCSIHWNINSIQTKYNPFIMLQGSMDLLKLPNYYYLSFALSIDEYFLTHKLYNEDIRQIIKILNLNRHSGWAYLKKGILHIMIGFNSLRSLKKAENCWNKKIASLIKYNSLNRYFNNIALISFELPKNSNDIKVLNNKARYLVHNLENGNSFDKYGSWFIDNMDHSSDFVEYTNKVAEFFNKNTMQEYAKEPFYVKEYGNNNNTNIKYLKNRILGFTNHDMEFFMQLPWYKFVYTNIWNKYLITSEENNNDLIMIETNNLDFKNLTSYTRKNTVAIVKPTKNNFNYDLINSLLSTVENYKYDNKFPNIGFYIEELDQNIFNYVHSRKINTFIISKDICSKILIDSEIYLKLQTFVEKINNFKRALIIYENLPENLEDIMVEKLMVKYYYNV